MSWQSRALSLLCVASDAGKHGKAADGTNLRPGSQSARAIVDSYAFIAGCFGLVWGEVGWITRDEKGGGLLSMVKTTRSRCMGVCIS